MDTRCVLQWFRVSWAAVPTERLIIMGYGDNWYNGDVQMCLITQGKDTQLSGSEREDEAVSVKMVGVGGVGEVREMYCRRECLS